MSSRQCPSPPSLCGLILAALFSLMGFPALAQAGEGGGNDCAARKMVWAHYVGWTLDFEKKFDDPNIPWPRYADRTALGKWTGTPVGLTSTIRLQIDAARLHGIDGFAVDMGDPRFYVSTMDRVLRAAEGTDFKVALCVDGWSVSRNLIHKQIAGHLARFLQKFGNHPNTALVDGKPVIFVYETSIPVAESAEILRLLKAEGHEAYWLVQPQRETAGFWEDRQNLDKHLRVFDGFYDFGINGFPPEKMRERLRNGRKALDAARKADASRNRLLVAGITPGYTGAHNAYYRPAHGTGTLRANWEAAIAEDADWVCLTTWNDYTENTQFEPTVWGGDALLTLNANYARRWQKAPPLPRPPEAIISYKPDVRLGDAWTIEMVSLPHVAAAPVVCHLALRDFRGVVFHSFPPVPLPAGETVVRSFSIDAPGITFPFNFQPVAALVTSESPSPDSKEWRNLFPVSVRAGSMRDMKTHHLRLSLFQPDAPEISFNANPNAGKDEGSLVASLPGVGRWAGNVEFIRDGIILARREAAWEPGRRTRGIVFSKQPDFSDLIPGQFPSAPDSVHWVRFNRADGAQALSTSFPLSSKNIMEAVTSEHPFPAETSQPVLVRNGNFDTTWQTRHIEASRLAHYKIPARHIYRFTLPMDDTLAQDNLRLRNAGPWTVTALTGGVFFGTADASARPGTRQETTPAGAILRYMSFDGLKSRIVLQPGSLPHDVMTIEIRVRVPARPSAVPPPLTDETFLFSDANGAMFIGLQPDGRIFVRRDADQVVSPAPLAPGRWHHLAAIYDGESLALHVDRKQVANLAVPSTIRPINSITAIGCKADGPRRFSHYFSGDMAGLAVTASPLAPEAFRLPDNNP